MYVCMDGWMDDSVSKLLSHVCVHVCMYVCMAVCMQVGMSACVYLRMYVCMYARAHLSMSVCTMMPGWMHACVQLGETYTSRNSSSEYGNHTCYAATVFRACWAKKPKPHPLHCQC